jgi:hypothetical protein
MIRAAFGTKGCVVKALLVAASVLAVVCGACFGLQAVVLGRPNQATLELVRTLHRLNEYHRSWASLDVSGRRYTESCRDQWYPHERVAEVSVDGTMLLPEVGDHLIRKGGLETTQFDLAGCPRPLVTWLATELEHHAKVQLLAKRDDGHRVFELWLPQGHPSLELLVGPDSNLPLELELSGKHEHGESAVHYGPER